MTTHQRLRALVREWREANKTLPPDTPHRAGMLIAAYCCAEDLQEVLDEMREQRRAAGRQGGIQTSPEKTLAVRLNAKRPRRKKKTN